METVHRTDQAGISVHREDDAKDKDASTAVEDVQDDAEATDGSTTAEGESTCREDNRKDSKDGSPTDMYDPWDPPNPPPHPSIEALTSTGEFITQVK
jgi:hypothetical protein